MADRIGNTKTRCLLAVLQGARTIDEVAAAVGIHRMTAYAHLKHLRERGLVSWRDGEKGTLHATCERVR